MLVTAYSLVGIRGDCDFMLWRIGYEPLKLQEMGARLLATGLGNYLATPYSYFSMTKRSLYVDKHTHEGQEGTRLRIVPGQFRYLFVYPFVKSKAWYRLTKHARQGMMDEHIEIGHRYPTVRLNTTYSFGLDDQEFVLAFESDKPEHFVDLVMELRHSEATGYTTRDTPTFTCVHCELIGSPGPSGRVELLNGAHRFTGGGKVCRVSTGNPPPAHTSIRWSDRAHRTQARENPPEAKLLPRSPSGGDSGAAATGRGPSPKPTILPRPACRSIFRPWISAFPRHSAPCGTRMLSSCSSPLFSPPNARTRE